MTKSFSSYTSPAHAVGRGIRSLAIGGRIVRFGCLALNMNRRIFFQTAAALSED